MFRGSRIIVLLTIAVTALSADAYAQGGDIRVRVHAGARPTQEPPPVRVERVRPRRGYVWVSGHWDWRRGRWAWVPGHWERERPGRRWREGRWDRQGGEYVWVAGTWDEAPAYPTSPPPEVRDDRPNTWRRGHVWVKSHYEWRHGDWVFVPGHWEKRRRGSRWRDGRWDRQGDRFVWVSGEWYEAPREPRDPPPPPINENPRGRRRGFIWVPGHYEWDDGDWEWKAGHWERERRGKRWREGRWEKRGDRYEFNRGGWDD